MPIAVLMAHTEKEYEPFDPYSRFYPAIPVSVCFSNTALYTLSKSRADFFIPLLHGLGSATIIKSEENTARGGRKC